MNNLVLRDYQLESVDHIMATETGSDLIRMPTGSGKTIVLIEVVRQYYDEGRHSLIIVHREHLIRQVIERFAEFYPSIPLGVVRGSERDWDAPVVVASVATAVNDTDTMPTDFDLIFTDEAHRCIAPTYFAVYRRLGLINEQLFEELLDRAYESDKQHREAREILESGKVDASNTDDEDEREAIFETARLESQSILLERSMGARQSTAIKNIDNRIKDIEAVRRPRRHIGLTATPQRSDDLGLGTIFSGVPYSCGVRDLIDADHLTDLVILPVNYRISKTELRSMLRDGKADDQTVALWNEYASNRKSTMAFCVNISHAEHLAECFNQAGVSATTIHSRLSKDARICREADFKSGRARVMTNVNVFIEGFDVPHLDCLIMARDTDSATLIPQALGRGMRKFDGKDDCLVIDLANTIDAETLSKKTDIFREIRYAATALDDAPRGVANLMPGKSHEYVIDALKRLKDIVSDDDEGLAWIPFKKIDGVALNLARNDSIYIGQSESGFYAVHVKNDERHARICWQRESMGECKDYALRYLLDNNLDSALIQRNQSWRLENATEAQVELLNKFGVELGADCSRGSASDMISSILLNREEHQ